jgi:hyperosmotically inducible protein
MLSVSGHRSPARIILHATKRHQLFEDGENVKTVNLLKTLGIALCLATASSAYAQSSDAAPSDMTDSSTARTKAVKKTDRKLGLDVRKALAKAQGFDVSNVFVRARGGAVTLTGSVPDGAQIPQAEDVAKSVAGVKSVSNKLTIGNPNGGGG